MMKRVLTLVMALCITVTSVGMDVQAYYQDTGDAVVADEEQGNDLDEVSQPEEPEDSSDEVPQTEEPEGSSDEVSQPEKPEDSSDEVSQPEDEETSPGEVLQQPEPEEDKLDSVEAQEDQEEESAALNFILMEKSNIQTPDTQNVVASIGKEEDILENAVLTYKNTTTGETFTQNASDIVQDMILFSMDYQDESQKGVYELESIHYTVNGKEEVITLSEQDMDVVFGVNTQVDAQPDDVIIDEDALKEVDANVVTMDENGNTVSESTVENVLDNNEGGLPAAFGAVGADTAKGNLVVVLDPGHDATHAGAQYYGYGEEKLVFKIAKYCRDELKTYNGVTVYMTRETESCVNGGSGVDSATCNAKRVEFATAKGADVYISFHLNASTSSAANGVGVYYPNGNFRPDLGQEGKELATKIYEKLSALGLGTWAGGTLIRDSQDGTTYPDGTLADYLGIIRRCKLAGIPAVLIEHAFLSNPSDVNNFLNSDEKLKRLGVADANAIAEYYGLTKGSTTPSISYIQAQKGEKLKVKWAQIAGAEAYYVYRSTEKNSGYKKVATVKSATEYIDAGIETGKTYYYKIKVRFSSGTNSNASKPLGGLALGKASINYVKSKSSGKLEISWKSVKGANGYKIYRSTAQNGSYQEIKRIGSGSETSYVDKVPKNNTQYYYKVQAINSCNGKAGCGSVSSVKYGKTVAKPKIKSVASVRETSLKISWNKISGASGYTIHRSTKKNSGYKKIATVKSGSTTSYTDKGVKKGTTYYYKMQTYNEVSGIKGYSGYSAIVEGSTVSNTSITSVKSCDSNTIEIGWKKISGAYAYKIVRAESKGGKYVTLKTVKAKNTTYKDTEVAAGKKYYYKVQTIKKVNGIKGVSGYSKEVYGKAVAKTSITYVKSISSSQVEVKWKEVSGAYGYRVKRSTSSEGGYTVIGTVKGKGTLSYRDKTAKAGKKYYYTVETINNENSTKGYSGNSKAVAGRALAKINFTSVNNIASKKVSLSWKKVTGASGYQIRRSDTEKGSYRFIANVEGADKTTYVDTSAQPGKTYYYKIKVYKRAKTGNGYSSYSSIKKAQTLKKAEFTKVASSNGKKVSFRWNEVEGAKGYRVQRSSTSAKKDFKTIATISSGETVYYTDRSVKAGEKYYYRLVAFNKVDGATGRGDYSTAKEVFVMSSPSLKSVKYTDGNSLSVSWKKVSNAAGYQVQRSTKSGSGYKTIATVSKTSYKDSSLSSATNYYYRVRTYGKLPDGTKVYSDWSSCKKGLTAYNIMGKSSLSVGQMVSYYESKFTFPASFYATKGASTTAEFFTILKEEADVEGVCAEVLFAQVILETGGLQYLGDVNREQCNFGGLGATGGGVAGETFPDIRTGLRAQVQHLKAYASDQPLKNPCEDKRFWLVTRKTAPYVEWLSIPKNPYGKGWATDPDYGTKLKNIIYKAK